MAPKKRQNADSSSAPSKKVKGKQVKSKDVFSNDFFSSLHSSLAQGQSSNCQKTTVENLRVAPDSAIASRYTRDAQTHKVYIDSDGIVYDATLNMSDAKNNNNKFYIIQLLTNSKETQFETYTRWGRVGEAGTTGSLSNGPIDDALAAFKKQFKSKTGLNWDNRQDPPKPGKYVFLPKDYDTMPNTAVEKKENGDIDKNETPVPPSKLPIEVQKLIELIFDKTLLTEVMFRMKYDNDSRPLGQLSEWTLSQGYKALKAISEILNSDNPSSPENLDQMAVLSNSYYSYIPHVIPRGQRPMPVTSMAHVELEAQLLQSLGYMIEANSIAEKSKDVAINPIDAKYNELGMSEMTPLKPTSKEFKELEAYLHGTVGSTHNQAYKIQDIFRIQKNSESARLEASEFANAAPDTRNRRLLWHGSRLTNFAGILSQGLRIAPPEAPVNGYAFGKGIYLADMSSKSAQYCDSGMTGKIGLMLLCEAELGKQWKLPWGDYQAAERAKESGCWSTLGEGSTFPEKWKDAKSVHSSLKGIQIPDVKANLGSRDGSRIYYNEYICYDVAQVQLRYVFRLEMKY